MGCVSQGRLSEDGTKRCPIDHGPTSSETFMVDVAAVVRRNFLEIDPDALEFALLALAS